MDGIRILPSVGGFRYQGCSLAAGRGVQREQPCYGGWHAAALRGKERDNAVQQRYGVHSIRRHGRFRRGQGYHQDPSRGGFTDLHEGERTVTAPDQLFGSYIEEYETALSRDTTDLEVTMRPLTYKYVIHYRITKGQEYVALARGALAGMAESVYLNDGHTGDESATLMFDCDLVDYGAHAAVTSFGVPNYPGHHYTRADGSEAKYTLSLQVRLRNGEIPDDFVFDVTDQINQQPRGGVIVIDGIEIESTGGGEGAFDVEVDGWGDYIDIELPL